MSRYELTDEADLDLYEIGYYIALDSEAAARRFLNKLRDKFQVLAENPRLGRSRDELRPELRSICVGDYLIFYRLAKSVVQIVRVVHGARDLDALFGELRE